MATKPDSANLEHHTTPLLKMKGLGGRDSTAEDHKSKGLERDPGQRYSLDSSRNCSHHSQSSTRKKKKSAARYRD